MKEFTPEQFTEGTYSTAREKAAVANAFVRFVESGFSREKFTRALYRALSNMWGDIAYYDANGFYSYWFTSTWKVKEFLLHTQAPSYDDPVYSWSDVERVLGKWVNEQGLAEKWECVYRQEVEDTERAELARLKGKYPEAE